MVGVVVRVRVSREQVVGQPVDAEGISQDLYFHEQERDQPLWLTSVLLLLPSHPAPSTPRKRGLEKQAESSAALKRARAL